MHGEKHHAGSFGELHLMQALGCRVHGGAGCMGHAGSTGCEGGGAQGADP